MVLLINDLDIDVNIINLGENFNLEWSIVQNFILHNTFPVHVNSYYP